jgi:site-specific DNA-methyltransferase (adenine-specific)
MIKLIKGDCFVEMKTIADNSVDAIVTDPPYGLSMGKGWDYDVPSQEIWEEALRVLKPGGYLLAFAGTRTQHRMAVRIEDAGFEIRDMIAWVYSSGFPKSLNIGKEIDKLQGNEREVVGEQKLRGTAQGLKYGKFNNFNKEKTVDSVHLTKGTSEWEGWGTAFKPALEPITVARKPIEKGLTIAENCLKWGTGGINIDACRVGTEIIIQKLATVVGEKAVGGKGIGIKQKETGEKTQTIGRFPANLIHDGSDEVVSLFPNTGNGNGGKPYSYSGKEYNNKETSMFNGDKPQAPSNFNDSGSASRFFYCSKTSTRERNEGCDKLENKNNHPTVKPIALMEYLIKLVSRENAIVLDPFMGSGSTGLAAKNLKRSFIGIEMDDNYFEIAKHRIKPYVIKIKKKR